MKNEFITNVIWLIEVNSIDYMLSFFIFRYNWNANFNWPCHAIYVPKHDKTIDRIDVMIQNLKQASLGQNSYSSLFGNIVFHYSMCLRFFN